MPKISHTLIVVSCGANNAERNLSRRTGNINADSISTNIGAIKKRYKSVLIGCPLEMSLLLWIFKNIYATVLTRFFSLDFSASMISISTSFLSKPKNITMIKKPTACSKDAHFNSICANSTSNCCIKKGAPMIKAVV